VTWEFFPECPEIMDDDFMSKLVSLRREYNRPMPVTSSYRPTGHDLEFKKKKPGPHTFGRAVDIQVSGDDCYHLIALAKKHGMTGIGLKQHGPKKKRIVHLDDMNNTAHRPRPTVWTYA